MPAVVAADAGNRFNFGIIRDPQYQWILFAAQFCHGRSPTPSCHHSDCLSFIDSFERSILSATHSTLSFLNRL